MLTPADRDAVLGDVAVAPDGDEVVLSMLDVRGADTFADRHSQLAGLRPRRARARRARAPSARSSVLSDPAIDNVYLPPSVAVDPVTRRVVAGIQSLTPQGFLLTARAPVS